MHIVLCIGPLARLDKRLLPLLFNRRHLGVITFMLGLLHALLVLVWYHGFGSVSPVHSLLTSNTSFTSLSEHSIDQGRRDRDHGNHECGVPEHDEAFR
ncbi:MAG: hypothetical protein WD768_12135 [Phycisphaeraceae bacterium]